MKHMIAILIIAVSKFSCPFQNLSPTETIYLFNLNVALVKPVTQHFSGPQWTVPRK